MSSKSTYPVLLTGAPATCEDIRYITGFYAHDPVVCFHSSAGTHLVVSELEYGRAVKEVTNAKVWTPAGLSVRAGQKRNYASWASGLLSKLAVNKVYVPWDFPTGVAFALRKKKISVLEIQGEVFPERALKTKKEIKYIGESQKAAVKAMQAAIQKLRQAAVNAKGYLCDGKKAIRSEDIHLLIEQILLMHECTTPGSIVACGKQAADPHETGTGPLMADQPIVIDIFPRHKRHGYWGDLTRTVVKGQASRKVREMYSAVKAAQTAALNCIRPGVSAESIHHVVQQVFIQRGFGTGEIDGFPQGFIHGTGHGVGLAIHEAPTLSAAPGTLETGHVVTVEPGLYYRDAGGVRIEDTIVVTKTGWEYLCTCSKRIHL